VGTRNSVILRGRFDFLTVLAIIVSGPGEFNYHESVHYAPLFRATISVHSSNGRTKDELTTISSIPTGRVFDRLPMKRTNNI